MQKKSKLTRKLYRIRKCYPQLVIIPMESYTAIKNYQISCLNIIKETIEKLPNTPAFDEANKQDIIKGIVLYIEDHITQVEKTMEGHKNDI